MSDVSVQLRWTGDGLRFDGETPRGHTLRIDSGRETGPSPMEALLFAFAGCTAIDIVDIAQKMRVAITGLEVEIEGDRVPEPPRRYTRIQVVYRAHGVAPADHDKMRRAMALSEEKYCSVRHSLRADIELTSSIELA